ncbi:ribonuclease HII [Alphaproteobacteria bacterium]|nr:ribonuclease HII [Alphaproteobacteria bacterium]GHS97425.1 ribonuclease HII [Alphaproteobacteria bacterium]
MTHLPDFSFEEQWGAQERIAGLDEAGRGPWAGPVVAAAVIVLDKRAFLQEFSHVNDSKKLTAARREVLFEQLQESPYLAASVGQASVEEIDSLNILEATFLAMKRALEPLGASAYLIDGSLKLPAENMKGQAIVKGDQKSYSIAAASIFAKVTRDRLMKRLGAEVPPYGWAQNMGYGTAQHQAALAEWGVTPHHRKSYAPIRRILESA